jgi:hypothetical protein
MAKKKSQTKSPSDAIEAAANGEEHVEETSAEASLPNETGGEDSADVKPPEAKQPEVQKEKKPGKVRGKDMKFLTNKEEK